MADTHDSTFSYSVSRPYPYRWFTWVVFIGGVIATVIFSLINFVAAGFEIVPAYTTNTTLIEQPDDPPWYQRRPWSLTSKIVPNCSAQFIAPGSVLYTSRGALPWTVDAILTDNINDSSPTSWGPQPYKGAQIGNCSQFLIQVGLVNSSISVGWDIQITCAINFAERNALIQLSTEFTGTSSGFQGLAGGEQTNFVDLWDLPANTTDASSLYWAELLMSAELENWYATPPLNDTDHTVWGMDLDWNANFGDKGSPPMISADFEFYFANGSFLHIIIAGNVTEDIVGELDSHPMPLTQWNAASFDSNVSVSITNGYNSTLNITTGWYADLAALTDGMGKVIYWTLLTDLGQSVNNPLADPRAWMDYFFTTVQKLCSNSGYLIFLDVVLQSATNGSLSCDSLPAPSENVSNFYAKCGIGMPNVQPAVFSQEYTCQVPKLKSAGALIISILVADLVFLQALWKLLNWLATLVLSHRNIRANYCAGCEEALRELRELRDEIGIGLDQTSHFQSVTKTVEDECELLRSDESSALMDSAVGLCQDRIKIE